MDKVVRTNKAEFSPKVHDHSNGGYMVAYAPLKVGNGPVEGVVGLGVATNLYNARLERMDEMAYKGCFVALLVSLCYGGLVHFMEQKRNVVRCALKRSQTALTQGIVERDRLIADLHAADRFAQSTMDALGYQIAVLDEQGTILKTNSEWKKFTQLNGGTEQGCGVGSNYIRVCETAHGPDSEGSFEIAQAIRDIAGGRSEIYVAEYPCHSPDTERWFQLRLSRFVESGIVRVVASHVDISLRKQAEDRLDEIHRGLEARIAERTAALENHQLALEREVEVRKQAEEMAYQSSQAKSEFISRMSHELRTPLNAVIGFAQLLQLESTDPRTLESAASILKGGTHLLNLVNEVLDMSKIEAGKLSLELSPVDGARIVDQASQMVGPIAAERKIRVVLEESCTAPVAVLADQRALLQVVLNLLSNAVKYNRPGAQINLRSSITAEMRWRLEVIDSGVGIEPSNASMLFVPFERPGNQAADGTGLGLALSRKLMGLMNGSLYLVSTSHEGSTFALELDIAPSGIEPAASVAGIYVESSEDLNGKQLSVVYIEDNQSNLLLIRRLFEIVGGVDLHAASTAREGVQMVEEVLPDVVLLDLHLPDAHGLDVLRYLRAHEQTVQIPVIVLSADATESLISELLNEGAQAYLTKPLDLQSVLGTLRTLGLGPKVPK